MSGVFWQPASGYYGYRDNANEVAIVTKGFKAGNRNVSLNWDLAWGQVNHHIATYTYYVNDVAHTYGPDIWGGLSYDIPLSDWGEWIEGIWNSWFAPDTEYTIVFEAIIDGTTYVTPEISFKTAAIPPTPPVTPSIIYPITKPNLINPTANPNLPNSYTEIWDAKCQNWVPINEDSYSNIVLQMVGGGRYKEIIIAISDGIIYYGNI